MNRTTGKMLPQLRNWYRSLTIAKQLLVFFFCNLAWWFATGLLLNSLVFEEVHSGAYLFFKAVWMAFFITLVLNWKKIKIVFGSATK